VRLGFSRSITASIDVSLTAGRRRTCFGLLGGGLRGFTPRSGVQVQFDLILLPHGSHEITALLASSTVQAFGGAERVNDSETVQFGI
jgi:hypothetical protein